MTRRNKRPLVERVADAAAAALAAQHHVGALDILLGIGWLPPSMAREWQQGRIDCLEEAIQMHPARLKEALRLLR